MSKNTILIKHAMVARASQTTTYRMRSFLCLLKHIQLQAGCIQLFVNIRVTDHNLSISKHTVLNIEGKCNFKLVTVELTLPVYVPRRRRGTQRQ